MAGRLQDLLLDAFAGGAGFSSTGREHNGAADAGRGAVCDNGPDTLDGRGDDGQIDGVPYGREVWIGADAVDFFPGGVDGMDTARKSTGDHIANHGIADPSGRVAGPDHGDRFRRKEIFEKWTGHYNSLSGGMAIFSDRFVYFPLRPGIPTRCLSRKYAIVEKF